MDTSIPGFQVFIERINEIYLKLSQIDKLIIHCNHGMGCSGLFTAGILLRNGIKLQEVLKLIEVKRGFQCPTSKSQLKFLRAYEN